MRFEKVSLDAFIKDFRRYGFREGYLTAYNNIKIPERKTKYSAGYDISTCVSLEILPGETVTVPTGLKAVFTPEEKEEYCLQLFIRSSVGILRGVVLSNQTGIVDADYADNPDNEGNMLIPLRNLSDAKVKFDAGDRIVQAIFIRHGITEDDNATGIRVGGVGSTGKE